MADGTSKPIDQVEVGDEVQNSAPDSESVEHHTVTAIHVTDTDRDFADLTIDTFAGPKTITTTAHRLFWDITTHTWTDAQDLKTGEEPDTPGNGHATIQALRPYTATIRTYNLTIDTLHTYYVLAGTTPVLVHNCGVTYVTYTKTNPLTGEVYSGRTSGIGAPAKIVAARDAGHHMNAEGLGPARVDQSTNATLPWSARHGDPAYQAVRGRDKQQLIDFFGSAKSGGGTSGNAIRGVAEDNSLRDTYMDAAAAMFGGPR